MRKTPKQKKIPIDPDELTLELQLYSPYGAQLRFHQDTHRFRVVAWGRQTGKSTACLNELLRIAWEKPNTRYWFIMPTHTQAIGMYRRCIGMLWNCREVMLKKNQTELRIKLMNQSEIVFKSGEVFDNLRSETLNGVIIDEVRDQRPDLWNLVIRPMLGTTGGWAAFVSTPRGYDHFFDLAEFAQKDTSGEWSFMHMPATESPLWPAHEIESIKRTMSEPEFAQEMLAEFRDLMAGRAYHAFSSTNLRSTTPFQTSDPEKLISDKLPVILGPDFNLHPMCWALGQTNRLQWYWFDEVYLENSHTQQASDALIQKLLYWKSRGLLRAQPNVIVCGDATGKAGQRAAAGESDYDILLAALKTAGISYENATPDSNPLIKDRINAVNAKCRTAAGGVDWWLNPDKCPKLKKDMERVTWKGSGILDPGPQKLLTHMSDGAGYPVYALTPVKAINDVGTPRVIVRRR